MASLGHNVNHQPLTVFPHNIDGLVQDCGNSIAAALELSKSCAKKPSKVYTISAAMRCEVNN